ncbi:MAG: NAD-dependent succinate-semialdehyde dehydrogenase [Thermoplasmata archaeon]|nr:NAD-dependent succinate-semialdehyde dehydrogenase [Thermoplasmata archaeon]
MNFKTINPATGQVIAQYETMSSQDISSISHDSQGAFLKWQAMPLEERIPHYRKLAMVLRENKEEYAGLMTSEMGKPISESLAEVEKCAWTAEVYADNAMKWLAPEEVEADGHLHRISYEPLGIILSIMPWNFPFWQALRFGIPTTLAGNVSILKHSNTVPQCAMAIEDAFVKAGFPPNIFRTIIADHGQVAELVASDIIQGVSLTGSTEAGKIIAREAGNHLKKVVLELGGSDPFIVLENADIDAAVKGAVLGRMLNAGQSCIAAKRFIVHEKVVQEFSRKFAEAVKALSMGDPADAHTKIGPLVNQAAQTEIKAMVDDALSMGASLLAGGEPADGNGFFFKPTVLGNCKVEMRVMKEEVFGPVAPIISVKDDAEAIRIANMTEFGLGGCVWTQDLETGIHMANQIESGTVFVNSITKSDPRMPFGGIKKSGIGRELAKFGIREFTNIKSMNIYGP